MKFGRMESGSIPATHEQTRCHANPIQSNVGNKHRNKVPIFAPSDTLPQVLFQTKKAENSKGIRKDEIKIPPFCFSFKSSNSKKIVKMAEKKPRKSRLPTVPNLQNPNKNSRGSFQTDTHHLIETPIKHHALLNKEDREPETANNDSWRRIMSKQTTHRPKVTLQFPRR
jgi:hypothetical protein